MKALREDTIEGRLLDTRCYTQYFSALHYSKKIRCTIKKCDVFYTVGNSLRRNVMPLFLVTELNSFKKSAIDFVGLINPVARRTDTQYIITVTKYLTIW